uniref:Nuclease HARBI1 n=1 Tax=Romanomermis culicivorax TaxID=13658 RepID=A0A915HUJ5_ROMCU
MIADEATRMREFLSITQFPNTSGAIDGTHIQISAPNKDEDLLSIKFEFEQFAKNYWTWDLFTREIMREIEPLKMKKYASAIKDAKWDAIKF